ncbi:hypothetical protein EVA_14671 [gut metagenome]|uniref:Uncharacterized protein n=1 Tax=gut metagenome TaxID=749906 RepID=J9FQJ8_9ZZZZ
MWRESGLRRLMRLPQRWGFIPILISGSGVESFTRCFKLWERGMSICRNRFYLLEQVSFCRWRSKIWNGI